MSSASPAAYAALPSRVSWRCRTSASSASGSRASPSRVRSSARASLASQSSTGQVWTCRTLWLEPRSPCSSDEDPPFSAAENSRRPMKRGHASPRCGHPVRPRCARRRRGCACRRRVRRRRRRAASTRRTAASAFFGGMESIGLTENRITRAVGPRSRPTTIVEKAFLDRSLPQRVPRAASTSSSRSTRRAPTRSPPIRTGPRSSPSGSSCSRARTRRSSDYTVGNEPNKSVLLAAPVRRRRDRRRGRDVRARARRRVRRAEGDRPQDHGRSASACRERGNDNPKARQQRLDLPDPLHPRPRRRLPRERPHPPIMDQLVFHPYPESPADDLLKTYALAERRLRQPRPDQAGGLGRVQRHRAADHRERAAALRRRDRLADLGAPRRARRVQRQGERPPRRARGTRPRSTASSSSAPPATRRSPPSSSSASSTSRSSTAGRPRSCARTTPRSPAYHIVREWITKTGGHCPDTPLVWKHATSVVGAAADVRQARHVPGEAEGVGVQGDGRRGRDLQGRDRAVRERPRSAGRPRARGGDVVAQTSGLARAHWSPRVAFPSRTLPAGRYAYSVELAAAMNPARKTVLVSAPFTVGAAPKK